jgi:hypothetical protein
VLLVLATLVALGWADSPWSQSYQDLWDHDLTVGFGRFSISEDVGHWVNDGLMAVFFVVGLEIKRELVVGELRDPKAASLPVLAAVGGMIVPAVLFVAIAGDGETGLGWGISIATDIAFVVGVLAPAGLPGAGETQAVPPDGTKARLCCAASGWSTTSPTSPPGRGHGPLRVALRPGPGPPAPRADPTDDGRLPRQPPPGLQPRRDHLQRDEPARHATPGGP